MPFNIHRHGFKRLLLAVSGGLDSICLAHFFIKNREALGIEWLGIAHVHHGLREGTADRDAAFVEAFAKSHGVPFFLKKLDGEALKAAEGSLEENARDARYKALIEVVKNIVSLESCKADRVHEDKAKGDPGTRAGMTGWDDKPITTNPKIQSEATSKALRAESIASLQDDRCSRSFDCAQDDKPIITSPKTQSEATSKCHRHDLTPHTCIVTAHHAGDQAETMLMRLKRGTTLAGLRGIQELRAMSCEQSAMSNQQSAEINEKKEIPACAGMTCCTQDDNEKTDPGTGSGMTSPKAGMTNANDNVTGSFDENRLRMTKNSQPQREQSDRAHTSYLIFRPFLNVTRSELLAYAHKHNLTWCEDESNTDVKFARNSIRHQLLPHLEKEVPGATAKLCRIAGLADKAYANILNKCNTLFATCLMKSMDSLPSVENNALQDDKPITTSLTAQSEATSKALRAEPIAHSPSSIVSYIAIDKKKLNKILQAHKDADLSELFRLWLSELGFRFPTGFFYAPKEPAHIKIPIRASYRKRSIIKIRHTVWICEFNDTVSALKFVSCEMKEKGLYE